jgi:hypothetical protein
MLASSSTGRTIMKNRNSKHDGAVESFILAAVFACAMLAALTSGWLLAALTIGVLAVAPLLLGEAQASLAQRQRSRRQRQHTPLDLYTHWKTEWPAR